MKTLKLLSLLLFVPLVFHAQKSLTGLWIGTLSNDSTTVRKDQSFEIALTQYKEKVYGYSRMNFIVNDTLYYIVKRVKGSIENDVCEVKDDDIISHNFPHKPDKGVKLISTFRRNLQDSVWRLDGEWKTTESKRHRYYSISGKISLTSEPDVAKSKIFPHLEELNLANDIAFYKESKKTNQEQIAAPSQKAPVADTRIAVIKKEQKQQTEPTLTKTEPQKSSELPSNTIVKEQKKDIGNPSSAAPEIKQQATVVTKEKTQKASEEPIASSTIKKSDLPASTLPAEQKKNVNQEVPKPELKKQETAVKKDDPLPATEEIVSSGIIKKPDLPASKLPAEQKKNVGAEMPKPEIKKQDIIVKRNEPVPATETIKPKTETKKIDPASIAKSTEENKVITREPLQPEFKIPSAAAFVEQRKTVAPQVVEFKSDSLELKLYDNGEIDGDTVSILLNGEILLAKQGLKASAIKKTIYIQPGSDEITLVLYAENLGKYPPNTGLLIVHDGEDVYQVRFSADLQQNAAVIFRRKK